MEFDEVVPDGAPSLVQVWGEDTVADKTGVTMDTYLESGSTGQNGNSSSLEIGNSYVGLLRFDLAAVPRDRQIASAELALATGASGPSVDSYAVGEPWTEAATWFEREPGVAWAAPGVGVGSLADSPIASFDVGSAATVTVDLLAVVPGWIEQPSTNHGIAFIAMGPESTLRSSEAPRPSDRPRLTLTFSP